MQITFNITFINTNYLINKKTDILYKKTNNPYSNYLKHVLLQIINK